MGIAILKNALLRAGLDEYHMEREDPTTERGAREAVRGVMVRLGIYDDFVDAKDPRDAA